MLRLAVSHVHHARWACSMLLPFLPLIHHDTHSLSLNRKVRLSDLAAECNESTFNPEDFPGCKLELPMVKANVFASGQVCIFKLRSTEHIQAAIDELQRIVAPYFSD
eukprot:TRINITY_DN7769_c0_g1_i1.p1 TRINITY_DN7769_c0_g1~~TRINITY_DN7769_c0_g1_i1.p1  ORF type:complete len:107 (+),score=21.55 TRINITY_DN7769_c0_g1_i1:555-875(+)